MRGVALLIAYLLGLGAIVSFGIAGLMALQAPTKPTPSAAPVAATSQAERVAKPIKQTTQKDAQSSQRRKVTHKRKEEAPSYSSDLGAYGYAQEPRRFYDHPFRFFGR